MVIVAALAVILVILFRYNSIAQGSYAAAHHDKFFKELIKCRETNLRNHALSTSAQSRVNPRWNPISGQKHAIRLRNATLFDGESVLVEAVDIVFEEGLIKSVSKSQPHSSPVDFQTYEVNGRFVTPGLVDIHSHHLEIPFYSVSKNQDVNEKPQLGPITPFIRAIDGFKPYDRNLDHCFWWSYILTGPSRLWEHHWWSRILGQEPATSWQEQRTDC